MSHRPKSPGDLHTVAILALPDVVPFDLVIPGQIFGDPKPLGGVAKYRMLLCGPAAGLVPMAGGVPVGVPLGLEALREADTVVVPGRSVADAPVAPEVVEGSVLTSAGMAAGIDLCLHVVRGDHGAEVANAIARRMVVPPHRTGGQAQYIEQPVPVTRDTNLRRTQAWALEHLHEALTVEELARRANMSPRHFARRFDAELGTAPLRWLLTERVRLAQRLLEQTDLPVQRIAERAGFGSAIALQQHFLREAGTTPREYRRVFRGLPETG